MLNFVFCSLFILFVVALYRFQNKPKLNQPPSPLALPVVSHLHLLGPAIHRSFDELSTHLGPLFSVRLGSVRCMVASSPELAKEFLKKHDLTFFARKPNAAVECLTYGVSFPFAPNGPYWKFIKKLCTHELLSSSSLNQFRPIRTQEIQCFIQLLISKAKAIEAVNLTEELLKLMNNIISRVMLSIRCSGAEGEADEVRALVREVTRLFGEFNVSDIIWFCKNLDLQGFKKRYEDTHRRYDTLLEKIIRKREQVRRDNSGEGKRGSDNQDFLDKLLDVTEDYNSEMKLTRDHIKALMLVSIMTYPHTQLVGKC